MKPKLKKFSVLLLYPREIADDYGTDNYYDFVEAEDVIGAVRKARANCIRSLGAHCSTGDRDFTDYFEALLVLEGYQYALAVQDTSRHDWNKLRAKKLAAKKGTK